jgi:hypothetical protein
VRATREGLGRELACEPRLANARLAHEQRYAALASTCAREQTLHRPELGYAADESVLGASHVGGRRPRSARDREWARFIGTRVHRALDRPMFVGRLERAARRLPDGTP